MLNKFSYFNDNCRPGNSNHSLKLNFIKGHPGITINPR